MMNHLLLSHPSDFGRLVLFLISVPECLMLVPGKSLDPSLRLPKWEINKLEAFALSRKSTITILLVYS